MVVVAEEAHRYQVEGAVVEYRCLVAVVEECPYSVDAVATAEEQAHLRTHRRTYHRHLPSPTAVVQQVGRDSAATVEGCRLEEVEHCCSHDLRTHHGSVATGQD